MTGTPSQSAGLRAAFGKRNNIQAKARFFAYRALKLAGKRQSHAFPDYLEFAPAVTSAHEFADLSTRVGAYLGDTGIKLYLPGPRFELSSEMVPYFEPSLVHDPGWLRERPGGTGWLVVHRLTRTTFERLVRSDTPGRVVDTRLHAYSEMEYFAMRNASSWPTYAPVETALERLHNIADAGRSAFILATGPSALTVDLASIDADVRITCNSAVRDLERIREFRPNIIACTDPVFHFGPSRYAAAFRRDLVRAAEDVDAIVLCGHDFSGPLLSYHPELSGRLAVLPHQRGGGWRWPTTRNPTLRHSGNVLTDLMLPVALMLADEVSIAGADGRQTTEKYFWKHNPSLQYSDELMQTVFDAHPAFFRDRDYADYYEQFCADVESLSRLAEHNDKTVRGVAPSWIPALQARGAQTPTATQ
jgi:hypothetical protein